VKVAAASGEVSLDTAPPDGGRAGAPGPPRSLPCPDESSCAVNWPKREQRGARTIVRGLTEPGTTVIVNGVPTQVAADGTFAAPE
jgi:hypothetical protein